MVNKEIKYFINIKCPRFNMINKEEKREREYSIVIKTSGILLVDDLTSGAKTCKMIQSNLLIIPILNFL